MAELSISTDIRDAVIESWEEDGTIADTVYPFVLNGNTIVVSNDTVRPIITRIPLTKYGRRRLFTENRRRTPTIPAIISWARSSRWPGSMRWMKRGILR